MKLRVDRVSLVAWTLGLIFLKVVAGFPLWLVGLVAMVLAFSWVCQWITYRARAELVVSYYWDLVIGSLAIGCLVAISPRVIGTNLCSTSAGIQILGSFFMCSLILLLASIFLSLVRLWSLSIEHQILKDTVFDLESRHTPHHPVT